MWLELCLLKGIIMDNIFIIIFAFILAPLMIIALVVNTVHIVHEETRGSSIYTILPGQRVIDYASELILSAGAIFFTVCLIKIIIHLFF